MRTAGRSGRLSFRTPPLPQGDSGFVIVRGGFIAFRSPPLQHFFDCPLQFGAVPEHTNASDYAEDADVFELKARRPVLLALLRPLPVWAAPLLWTRWWRSPWAVGCWRCSCCSPRGGKLETHMGLSVSNENMPSMAALS